MVSLSLLLLLLLAHPLKPLNNAISGLPQSMKDEIMEHARSVEAELFDYLDKNVKNYEEPVSQDIIDQVIFLAGIRKFFSIVESTFSVLDNSIKIIEREKVKNIKIESDDFSRDSKNYKDLSNLASSLKKILVKKGIYDFMHEHSLSEMIEKLRIGQGPEQNPQKNLLKGTKKGSKMDPQKELE